MKCISLWQPWASLWALGLKQWETRHWKYPNWLQNETIYIHAATKWDSEVKFTLEIPEFVEALQTNKERILLGSNTKTFNGISLPIGALIGTVKLVRCTPTETAKPSDLEEMFGNYDSGRFAWVGVEHKVITPIPFIGRQGFFDHEKQQYPLFS